MKIVSGSLEINIVDERGSSFDAPTQVGAYAFVKNLDDPSPPCSVCGIHVNTAPVALLGTRAGGPTRVHAHSALFLEGLLYVAIGHRIVCMRLRPFAYRWALCADEGSCCGVYFENTRRALICCGELSISRFTEAGSLLWQSPGEDIFTGRLSLESAFVKVFDFNGREYRFRYEDGSPV